MSEWRISKKGKQIGQLSYLKETGILDEVIATGQSFEKMAVLATEALLGIPVLRGNLYYGIMSDPKLRETYFAARPIAIWEGKEQVLFQNRLARLMTKDLEKLVLDDLHKITDPVKRSVELYQWNTRGNKLHEDKLYEIFAGFYAGKCVRHISYDVNVNYGTVKKIFDRTGQHAADGRAQRREIKRITPLEVQSILRLVKSQGYNQTSRNLKISYNAVRRIALRHNVKSPIPCLRKA